jgi:uncharacterized protein YjbI with pentapeptide repeats
VMKDSDLRGMELAYRDLNGADSDVRFYGSDLRAANLRGANLKGIYACVQILRHRPPLRPVRSGIFVDTRFP